ncbi:MAG: hydrogenase/urease maturation nickel metallochaperone HypA [Bacillota bacterium]
MREASLMRDALDAVKSEAAREGVRRVRRVAISFRSTAHLFSPALREAFEDIAGGDPSFRGAVLDLEERPVLVRCLHCGWERECRDLPDACSECGSGDLMEIEEDDLKVEFFEAETGALGDEPRPDES